MELNPAPSGTEMVYDEQGNEVEAISPEEAARRRAEAQGQLWMPGTGNTEPEINSESSNNNQYNWPGYIDYNQDWLGNSQKLREKDQESINAWSDTFDLPKDPANYGYMLDHKTGEIIKNPKGISDNERGLVWSGQYDNPDTNVNESMIWSNPASQEEFNADPGKYDWDQSYIVKNPDGTESSVRGIGSSWMSSESSPYKKNQEELWEESLNTEDNYEQYIAEMPKHIRKKYYKELNKQAGYERVASDGSVSDDSGLKDKINEIKKRNSPYRYALEEKEYGGSTTGAMPDPQGNLQRFVYGGNDMDVSPMVAYDNNDIQTKNVDDPYMFREGGLYEYDGEENSQVYNPKDYPITNPGPPQPLNQYQTPAYKRYNSNATAQSNFAAYNEMKQRGLVTGNYNPTQTYDMSNTNNTTTTNTNTQNQRQNQGNYYPQGYPTAPTPFQQVKDMFSIFKKNPETGKNYDFTWMSQNGPARTSDGNIWQPPGQTQGQTTTQGQTNQGAGTNQTNPKQAGYMYDYKYEKGPWWSGKKTVTLAGKWVDPNNPNAGKTTSTNPMADGKGPVLNPNTTTTNTTNIGAQPNGTRYVQGMTIGKDQMLKTNTDANGNPMGIDSKGRLVSSKAPAGSTTPTTTTAPITTAPGVGTDGFVSEGEEMNPPVGFAYGGYVPEFQFAGQFNTSSGPFNPSGTTQVGGIGQGLTGPCTEAEVQDPNSPCYDPNYKPGGTGTPQDFEVSYDVKKARTLNTKGIANIMGAVGSGIQGLSAINQNIYNDDYLNSRTTADNREPSNELDYRGGYSGLNQRIMSKGQGAGSTGFNSVVGNAAFVKKGGQLNYQRGEVYDLTQEEIGKILAAGGQLEFIS